MDFRLESLGWRSFQDLCLTACSDEFGVPFASFSAGPDGGQDGRGILRSSGGPLTVAVQCKHFSRQDRRLRKSDVEPEYEKIAALVAAGSIDAYRLYTNARTSAPMATAIEGRIVELGVKVAQVIGGEYLNRILGESPRLRGLIPRLYGLGDLSEILDDRIYRQSAALLAEFSDQLETFVPTVSYLDALAAVEEHAFCLLLGQPGCGKSAIARAIAVHAIDRWGLEPLWISSLEAFENHWNPDRHDQLFIVDDVFGSVILDDGAVDRWNRLVMKIQSATRRGTRFLLTSRDYVFASARSRLKKDELPASREGEVVIDVHALTAVERRLIVYNHLKHSRQPDSFLTAVKVHLHAAAASQRFLPETARRLAEPQLTVALDPSSAADVSRFVEEPREYLCDVIRSLPDPLRHSLFLLAFEGGEIESPVPAALGASVGALRFGISPDDLAESLTRLSGGLTRRTFTRADRCTWTAGHPTILDATYDVLAGDPQTLDLYLDSAPVESIVRQVTCGADLRGAIRLPAALYPRLRDRLVRTAPQPEERLLAALFGGGPQALWPSFELDARIMVRFLAYRCSTAAVVALLREAELENLLGRWEYGHDGMPLDSDAGVRLVLRMWLDDRISPSLMSRELREVVKVAIREFDPYPLVDPNFEAAFVETFGPDAWLADVVTAVGERAEDALTSWVSRQMDEFDEYLDRSDYFARTVNSIEWLLEWIEPGTSTHDVLLSERDRIRTWAGDGEASMGGVALGTLGLALGERPDPGGDIFSDLDERDGLRE